MWDLFERLTGSPERLVTTLLVLTGIGLRLWQYLANASLWIDEASLARNIIERPASALLQPLDYAQVAPPGFLIVEKLVVTALGPSEFALRLFPLLCGILSLVLFVWLALAVLDGWAATYAIGLFAIGSPFVYFPSQVKQYSSDILCAVLVTSCALWMRQRPDRRRTTLLALAGAVAVWFSQPATFIVIGTTLGLALDAASGERRKHLPMVLAVGLVWLVSVAGAALVAFRNVSPLDRVYFNWFWGPGFWPLPPGRISDVFWPFNQLTLVFGTFISGPRRTNGGLNYPWSAVFAAVVLLGYVALWKTKREAARLLIPPPVLALLASVLALYPFSGRVMVYLLPGFILSLAAGARFILARWPTQLSFASPVALALLGGAPIYAAAIGLPPERIEHMRPALAALSARLQPGDTIYLHHSAGQSFLYYSPRFGFRREQWVMGRCSAEDPRAYLRQVDRFRGRDGIWLVGTHLYYPGPAFRWIASYLDAIGRRTESIVIEASTKAFHHGAYAYRYDLSDAGRLTAASADSFALPANLKPDPEGVLACHGVESPLGRF